MNPLARSTNGYSMPFTPYYFDRVCLYCGKSWRTYIKRAKYCCSEHRVLYVKEGPKCQQRAVHSTTGSDA